MDTMFKMMAWSFNCLWEGTWPVRDWLGNVIVGGKTGYLADGHFGCVWNLICDLDFSRDKLKQVNCNSVTPCNLCPCNSTSMPWHHFSFAAEWLLHIYTTADWVASGAASAEIFNIEGVTNDSLYPDWMHAKHLGSDKVLGGERFIFACVFYVVEDSCSELAANLG